MKILDQGILDLSPPSYKFEKNMLKNSSPIQQILRNVSTGKEMSLSSKNKMAD